jgi:hypothetical protein
MEQFVLEKELVPQQILALVTQVTLETNVNLLHVLERLPQTLQFALVKVIVQMLILALVIPVTQEIIAKL